MKKRVISLLLLIFMFDFIKASDFKVECPTKANAIAEVKCDISVKPNNYQLDGIMMNYEITSGVYVKFNINSNYSSYSLSSEGVMLNRNSSYSSSSFDKIGTLVMKMPSSGSLTVKFLNIVSIDSDREEHDFSDVTKTIKVNNTNNYLSNINISEGNLSPSFDKNTTTYDVKDINTDSILITPVKDDESSTISGDFGNKKLKYGKNTFKITVTSEAKVNRIYTINVYRTDNRDKTNTLSMLDVDGYTLNPTFDKNKTSYSLNVKKDITSVNISAKLDSEKSSFVSGYGPRNVKLEYGDNSVLIKVKSESESIKTYTIKIVREDARSSNNYLKSLNVTSGDFKFDKKTLNYSFTVSNDTESIKVLAEAEDNKSVVSGSKTYNLKEGLNKITITVTAENKSKRVYTLQVTRIVKDVKNDINNKLDSLEIENYQINFDPETTIYNLTIENEKNLNIDFKTQDVSSSAVVYGNENLVDGSSIKVVVTAVDGSVKEYIINISKNEEVNSDENKSNNNAVSLNDNRKVEIIIGVSSAFAIIIIIIIFVYLSIKKSLKKRAGLWK